MQTHRQEKTWQIILWSLIVVGSGCLIFFSHSATRKIVAHQERAIEEVQAQTQSLITDAVINMTTEATAELRQIAAAAEHQIETSGNLVSTSIADAITAFLAINNGPVGLILENGDGELYLTDAAEKIEMMAPADAYPVLSAIAREYTITDDLYNIFVDFSAVANGDTVNARLVIPKASK